MELRSFSIGPVPTILLGKKSDKVCFYVHGQGGNKSEAPVYTEAALSAGYQVLAVDLPEHGERTDPARFLPWTVQAEFEAVKAYLYQNWSSLSVMAVSIGAWFSMLSFPKDPLEKCLFVSPVLDMENLIRNMMKWASVTEDDLRAKGEIPTDFGQTLSWKYLCYVREHPIRRWDKRTEILYADGDHLIPREVIDRFVDMNRCGLSVMEGGEHWFHTPEQIRRLTEWERSKI